jgi:exopolysaccharide production protein ExoY
MKDSYEKMFYVGNAVSNPIAADASPRGFYQSTGKRLFDVVFSLFALAFSAVIIAILWVPIRLDGGSALYGQKRVGKDGRLFTCWKLRTMVPGAEEKLEQLVAQSDYLSKEWSENQKLQNDPRITRIGKILRKTRFDELPQFWNVLMGDMSVVGPRPFMPSQGKQYCEAGGDSYFLMRPGLTGLWQVAGSGSREQSSFESRAVYDEAYARSITFRGDMVVVLKTILTMLRLNGH